MALDAATHKQPHTPRLFSSPTRVGPGVAMSAALQETSSPATPKAADTDGGGAKGAAAGSTSSAGGQAPLPAPLVPLSSRFALRPLEAIAVATRRQVCALLCVPAQACVRGRVCVRSMHAYD